MIHIHGERLTRLDRRFLKLASIFTMDYLLPTHKNIVIRINVGPTNKNENEDDNASCLCINKKCFAIWINQTTVNSRAKTRIGKYKKLLSHVFHELVHVKQYATSELVDFESKYRYRGKVYLQPVDEDSYYESPFEIEAYGREIHLVTRFKKHWKKLVKESNGQIRK